MSKAAEVLCALQKPYPGDLVRFWLDGAWKLGKVTRAGASGRNGKKWIMIKAADGAHYDRWAEDVQCDW